MAAEFDDLDAMMRAKVSARIEVAKTVNIQKQQRSWFFKQYRDDWVALIHDCVDWDEVKDSDGLTDYQCNIVAELQAKKRVAATGPRGLGKTALASLIIHAFILTTDGDDTWKLPTTAGSWKQLTNYLWPEVHYWADLILWDKTGRAPYDRRQELLQHQIKGQKGSIAFAVAVTQPELIEGAHANRLLFVYDESKVIPAEIFNASEGAFSGAGASTGREAFALAISTPGDTVGRFYEIFTDRKKFKHWHTIHVTLADCLKAKRVSSEWVEERGNEWGTESQVYQNHVDGVFAPNKATSIIPLNWVERAMERWTLEGILVNERKEDSPIIPIAGLNSIGADPSSGGGDPACIAYRYHAEDSFGNEGWWYDSLDRIETKGPEDLMPLTGSIVMRLLNSPVAMAIIDVIGIGAGVYSRLIEQRLSAVAFGAANRSVTHDETGKLEFANDRSRAWWYLRQLLDPSNGKHVAIPRDSRLLSDLTTPQWTITSSGKILVEAKDDIRERRDGKSTDEGDAVVMAAFADLVGREVDYGNIVPMTRKKVSTWNNRSLGLGGIPHGRFSRRG